MPPFQTRALPSPGGRARTSFFISDSIISMAEAHRVIVTFREGNAVGVIDEPIVPGGVPPERRRQLWNVKIGVVDENLARLQPFPRADFLKVIERLSTFLDGQGVGGQDRPTGPKRRNSKMKQRDNN